MIGEERPGHKYTRRAPDGKGGWVYYYETEDAERAHHYEEHHHPIHRHWQAAEAAQRHPPRTDHYSEEERSDTPRAPRVADPPPPSAAAARVLALVPADLLQDAEGTPEERLAAVAKRAPDVLARIEGLLSAALVAPSDAQDLVYDLLQREGWDASGRAEVIAAALSERGALYVRHRRQLGDAAERLAQGRPVQSAHVAAAADLLALGTASGEGTSREDPGFPDAVSDLGNAAAAELDRLRGLLEAAKRDHSRAAEFVASAAASDALLKLRALSRAFPGTDHDAAAVEETLNAAQALASRTDITDRGSEAALYVAGPDGRPVARRVVYRLAEASDLVPSHDPVSFAPSAAYPEGLQERAYHRDKDEQAKVILNAQSLNPDFLVNTDPTAANGPPVIYPDGVALGGNSRTMAMIRAYRTDPNKGAALRSALMSRASAFGFRPADVKALVNPILVRELEPLPGDDPRLLVRQLNEGFTQAIDPKTAMVAISRRFDDAALTALGEGLDGEESLGSYLKSGRSRAFRDHLERVGLIDARNRNQYLDAGGGLNDDGVRLVERAVVGKLIDDADLLVRTPDSLVSSLARALPSLAAARTNGPGYDLGPDLRLALEAHAALRQQARGGAVSMPGSAVSAEELDGALATMAAVLPGQEGAAQRALASPTAMLLLETLIRRPGVRQLADAFAGVAAAAEQNQNLGQVGLFASGDGAARSPEEVVHGALARALGEHGERALARSRWGAYNKERKGA